MPAAAIRLTEREPSLTAILAGNDKMAIGAISGLKDKGYRIPEDLSIVGCDDMHQAEFSDPPLTTVHTPIYEVGVRACEALLDMIEGRLDSVAEVLPVQRAHDASSAWKGSTAPCGASTTNRSSASAIPACE